MVVQRVLPRRSNPKSSVTQVYKDSLRLLSVRFRGKVKTRQSSIPRTGLGVSPMQTGVWAVGGQVD